MYQTASNAGQIGSSFITGSTASQDAVVATATAKSGSSTTASPGLNGHQTSASSETAAGDTPTTPSATPTKQSNAIQLDTSLLTTLFTTIVLIVLIAFS
jgi:hypothetical protein